ncbi:unnamed protein product, partial [Musa acuminata var. zebrina]
RRLRAPGRCSATTHQPSAAKASSSAPTAPPPSRHRRAGPDASGPAPAAPSPPSPPPALVTLATAAAPSAAPPPVTLAEFTLAGSSSGDQDFYDVSLVDGYNFGVGVRPSSAAATAGTRGTRRMAGATGEMLACGSACEAFGAA